MTSGINFEQGEILLVPFPFTNLQTIKQRPVLVLSKTEINKFSVDFVCCGITSNIQNIDHSVLMDNKNLEYGYLPKPSRIKVSVIFTLEKSSVIKGIGKIKEETFNKVKEEFLKLF
ncbi:MAG: type II toxin-antitoxin system PemK/MazF family toxin [Candidatus Aenigmarchaeota archaeon]|nr:type II toxin-antitoxin system PemK/MazF family toxin [Candidatus Aenigmarchaeota archaeon]